MKQLATLFFLFFLCVFKLSSQDIVIRGKVMDEKTEDPLAFVNVIYGTPSKGTTTNIDGEFMLRVSEVPDVVEFSYLGYYTQVVSSQEISGNETLLIKMKPKSFDLEKVVIKPGENPANAIISKVYENSKENNPENLESFSYKSYNKMVFTMDTTDYVRKEMKQADTSEVDSADIRLKKFIDKQHLFLMESISERYFLSPARNKEKVVASRVSGFKDPSLVFLATQFQSFSFYDNFINISDYSYLNPITKHSSHKYYFQLEDTLYTPPRDSIFIISFRPREGKNFDALKGMLHISTKGYAVQKVIAEPAQAPKDLGIKIQQQYEYIKNRQWFPTQLNTQIKFYNVTVPTQRKEYFLKGDGRTYIRNIRLNPDLDPGMFDRVEVEVPDSAYRKAENYWKNHRTTSLSERDRHTYRFIDSIGKVHHFDRKLKTFQVLATGYYPYKFLNIDYRKFFSYNKYEGVRLGFGAMTNDKISRFFSLGGYWAYGFKDKEHKYGGSLVLYLHEDSETELEFSYLFDVAETGNYSFLMDYSFASTENFRKYLVQNMDLLEKKELKLTFRSFQYLKTQAFFNQHTIDPLSPYIFNGENRNYSDFFHFTEAGMKLKFAYKERFIRTPWGMVSEGTNYPVLYANITRADDWLGGEFSNWQMEGRLSKTFVTKNFGKTHLNIMGGYATGDLPVFSLYNGNGSYGSNFSLQVDNSFGTMQLDEFYVERFVSVFFRQNFGSLLFKTSGFSPRFSVVGNAGWGWLGDQQQHQNIDINSFDKGYYETGLLLDNLLSVSFFNYGFGVYYRFGPYAFDKEADNFAYKLSFRFNF